jgi:hypothetical protein
VRERFGLTCGKTGIGHPMRGLGLSWRTPRPPHTEADRSGLAGRRAVCGTRSGRSLSPMRGLPGAIG